MKTDMKSSKIPAHGKHTTTKENSKGAMNQASHEEEHKSQTTINNENENTLNIKK